MQINMKYDTRNNMETYTYREALENVVGYLFNPIMKRQNPDLYESARIIKEHLDKDEEIDRAEELADLIILKNIML